MRPAERANAAKYFWADERGYSGLTVRETFRMEHRRAMGQLGRCYLLDRQADLAIPLFKRLLEDEPTVEDVARDLFRCYEQLAM